MANGERVAQFLDRVLHLRVRNAVATRELICCGRRRDVARSNQRRGCRRDEHTERPHRLMPKKSPAKTRNLHRC